MSAAAWLKWRRLPAPGLWGDTVCNVGDITLPLHFGAPCGTLGLMSAACISVNVCPSV